MTCSLKGPETCRAQRLTGFSTACPFRLFTRKIQMCQVCPPAMASCLPGLPPGTSAQKWGLSRGPGWCWCSSVPVKMSVGHSTDVWAANVPGSGLKTEDAVIKRKHRDRTGSYLRERCESLTPVMESYCHFQCFPDQSQLVMSRQIQVFMCFWDPHDIIK